MNTLKVTLPDQLPVTHEADIIVAGGGPGGIGAAVAAARCGANVLLVEHYGFLGGMATAGEVNPFMPNHFDGQSLDTGIFEQWLDRMSQYGGTRGGRIFDPNVARLAAEDLCLDAGVKLLYHHRTAHVQKREGDPRHIEALVLHSKSGLTAAKAKQFIDSTGDGDVAAMAGCAFEYGAAPGKHGQPMTMCFKLKLDPRNFSDEAKATGKDLYQLTMEQYDLIQRAYKQAQADGRIDCPRENVLMFRCVEDDVVHFNTTRVIHHASIDGAQLSEAEIIARRQIRQLFDVLRAEVPAFKDARLYSIAPQIGVRESRRITGRAYVTMEDYQAGRTFPDGIARVTYGVDIHNPDGTGTLIVHLPKDAWYEIPFGSLLPRDVDNLVIGGRSISVDHAVHSSVRVMPPVVSLGQAAGTAAAMAVSRGVDVCRIDGVELKQKLIEQGRNLVPFDPRRGRPATTAAQDAKRQKAEVSQAGKLSA